MLIADVNVFVSAHRRADPRHVHMRRWLDGSLDGAEPFGASDLVLSAFLRIVTNHRSFPDPTPLELALEFCEAVRGAPATQVVVPGSRHWAIFTNLCRQAQARANVVPDAYLAALALENGATFVTSDRGFARFEGLRLLDPLAAT